MKDAALRLKFEIRSLVAREPALAPFLAAFRWKNRLLEIMNKSSWDHYPGPRTEIMIDGMQGSANSFVAAAFSRVQTRPVEVSHHVHSPAQILKAVRLGLPTLVTIREPVGAALSLVTRWPYVRARQALRAYLSFYGRIEDVSDRYVVGLFSVCTSDLGTVIREVNRRFGTDFVPFEHTEENMRVLRNPARVNRESEVARRELKKKRSLELEAPDCKPLLGRARELYRRFEERAPGAGKAEPKAG